MKHTVSLNQNTLFKRLYYRGKSFHAPYFVLYVLPNSTASNRLGITVSKKIGKAVCRNHIRRWLYEAFRLYEPKLKTGVDLVLVAKASANNTDFHHIHRVMGGVLKKANLYATVPVDAGGNTH